MLSAKVFSMGGRVEGSLGEMKITNMTGPQYFHRVVVETRDPRSGVKARRKEKVEGEATYWYQLKAFAAAVQDGAPYPTTPADAIANMKVIDAVYRAAGLQPRAVGVTDKSKLETWLRSGDGEESVIIPAATVVLVRERAGSLETLMLKKNSKLAFGGMWVFPVGRIDDADREGAPDIETAAKRAAVREAAEEAGLVVDEGSLAWISHWLPPALAPKRFATYFFVAPAPAGCGDDRRGRDPRRSVDAPRRRVGAPRCPGDRARATDVGDVARPGGFDTVDALMADAHAREPEFYETHMGKGEAGMFALWAGDAAYESGDADAPGPRHRLLMSRDGSWTLER